MNVLVIGATGQVGRKTVEALLKEGHSVTSFGRSTGKLDPSLHGQTIRQGDVMNINDVDEAMPGHDIVVLTFGAPPTTENILHKPDLCEAGTRNVVKAMTEHGIPRLVCMTAIGAGDSEGHGQFMFRNIIEPLLLGRIMQDRTAQEEVVKASDLPEWVIVRPTELSDGPSNAVRVIEDVSAGPEPKTISRTDVGKFLARVATDTHWDGQAILITN